MKFFVFLMVTGVIFGLGAYAYCIRTNYNVDHLDQKIISLNNDIAILSYALSIVPKSDKNEIFLNSVKSKFPEVENNIDILKVIDVSKEELTEKEIDKIREEEHPSVKIKLEDEGLTIKKSFNELVNSNSK